MGIFPLSYVSILPPGHSGEDHSAPNLADPVVLKCAQAVLEWGEMMNAWLNEGSFDKAKRIQTFIGDVIRARATVLNPKTDAAARKAAKREIRAALARCTTELGLSFTVAGPGGVFADDLNTSTMELYRMYREIDTGYKPDCDPAAAASSVASGGLTEKKLLMQVFLKFNAFICKLSVSPVLLFLSCFSLTIFCPRVQSGRGKRQRGGVAVFSVFGAQEKGHYGALRCAAHQQAHGDESGKD